VSFPVAKLGEVCSFVRGLTYSKSDEVEFSSNVVIRATNIDLGTHKLDFNELRYISDSIQIKDDKRLKKDDILICTASGSKSHLGKVAIVDSDLGMAFGGFMGALRVNPLKITPQYFFTFLVSSEFKRHIESLSDGANINNLKFSQIENLEIPLPPLSTQKKIVAKLDAIFSEIDKATAAAEENAKNAEALFQSYLNEVFERDGEGWNKTSLKDIAEYFNGLTYSPNNVCEDGTVVLRSSNVQSDKILLSDIVRVNSTIKDKLYVRNGDILMCSRNGSQRLVGKTATIEELDEKMTFGTFMMIVRSESNFFIQWFFKSDLFKLQIASGENTMINQITRYMLDEVVISMPDYETQKSISKTVFNLYNASQVLKLSYKEKIYELKAYKNSILKQAFAGELVKE
jgi:type I restriction enzyme S subunit